MLFIFAALFLSALLVCFCLFIIMSRRSQVSVYVARERVYEYVGRTDREARFEAVLPAVTLLATISDAPEGARHVDGNVGHKYGGDRRAACL